MVRWHVKFRFRNCIQYVWRSMAKPSYCTRDVFRYLMVYNHRALSVSRTRGIGTGTGGAGCPWLKYPFNVKHACTAVYHHIPGTHDF